jgi:hypothetical protein
MLTRLCESDDLVCDDFSHLVINIPFERERVADLVKCGAHRLNVRGIDMVLGEWHRDVSPAPGTWKFAIFSGQSASLRRTVHPQAEKMRGTTTQLLTCQGSYSGAVEACVATTPVAMHIDRFGRCR